MTLFFQESHHPAEDLKVAPFGSEFKVVSFEKRNDYRQKIIPPEYFKTITMLMVRARILLEIDTAATEEISKSIQNVFVFLDELYIELWFYDDSASNDFLYVRISNIDSEASFTIYEPDNILGTKILH